MSTEITGGCGCGAVRFALDQLPVTAIYCHCTRCQRRSGTAAAFTARVHRGSMRFTAGEDRLGRWAPEGGGVKVFCGDCGSALCAMDPETGEAYGVRMGAFDEDPGVRASAHQFVAYAAPWAPLPDDGLPRYEERMPTR